MSTSIHESRAADLLEQEASNNRELGELRESMNHLYREIETLAVTMQDELGEFVCRGCLRPWSVAHHQGCSGRVS